MVNKQRYQLENSLRTHYHHLVFPISSNNRGSNLLLLIFHQHRCVKTLPRHSTLLRCNNRLVNHLLHLLRINNKHSSNLIKGSLTGRVLLQWHINLIKVEQLLVKVLQDKLDQLDHLLQDMCLLQCSNKTYNKSNQQWHLDQAL